MSLQACADIVRRGDPDRFVAAMAAPVAARSVLFPIYAFNVEVSRAPWVTQEPGIAEMRLQWWRDILEEVVGGDMTRRHEVAAPLSDVLNASNAGLLDQLVQARRWDIYKDSFEDDQHFDDYIERTGGNLMVAALCSIGNPEPKVIDLVSKIGAGTALVRFLAAVPKLEAMGRVPLIDGRSSAVAALAGRYLEAFPDRKELRKLIGPQNWPAIIEAWQAKALLKKIVRHPEIVAQGQVAQSEFRRRVDLLFWAA